MTLDKGHKALMPFVKQRVLSYVGGGDDNGEGQGYAGRQSRCP